MDYVIRGVFWVSVYVLAVVAPMFVLLLEPSPPGRGFWWDFHVALGFAATVMMGMMFLLTSRSRNAARSFGMDILYYFHRRIALAAFAFAGCHVLLVFAVEPGTAGLLSLDTMPRSVRPGVAALLLFAALIAASIWRKQLGLDYDRWRFWHSMLAMAVVTLAILHMVLVGYYTSSTWKVWLWSGLAVGWLGTVIYVRLARPLLLLRRPYQVVEVRRQPGDTSVIILEPDGHPGLPFQPGQFVWLSVWSTPFALKEHPFSIASSACRPDRLEFAIKAFGDFTHRIQDVEPGTVVYVDGPHGSFSPDRHDAAGYVFVAGGIGIAPVLSMLRTFADRDDRRPLLLVYAVKSMDTMVCRDLLEELGTRLNLTFVPVPESPPADWKGESGFVTEAMLTRYLPDHRGGARYFLCGPTPMTQIVERALRQQRVPMQNIHSELFDLV